MLKYEICEQLKSAGFPTPKGADEEWSTYDRMFPTLEELIEACGGALESLENKVDRKSMTRVWKAWGIEMEPWNPASNQMGQGSTPEEAVALLWLKLNKHD